MVDLSRGKFDLSRTRTKIFEGIELKEILDLEINSKSFFN